MDTIMETRNEFRAQSWAQVIKDCAESGLTNKEYCMSHGIKEKTFYYWLRKLRTQACEQAAPRIVAIDPIEGMDTELRIYFKGAELKFPENVDIDAIAALLKSMQTL